MCYNPPTGKVHKEFPHYKELDQVWRSVPGFDSNLISSDPAIDHAQSLLTLVQNKSGMKNASTTHIQEEEEESINEVLNDTNDGYDINKNDDGAPLCFDVDMQINDSDGNGDRDNGDSGWQPGQHFDSGDELMATDDLMLPLPSRTLHNTVSIKHAGYCFDVN